jgi:hypothetical protein
MRLFSLRPAVLLVVAGLVTLSVPTRADADTVLAGWDLFQTQPGTMFDGVDFTGVPITNFTFPATNPEGNPIFPRNPNLATTDTIIERMQNVTAPALMSGTTSLVMQALQIMTTAPVAAGTFGAGTPAGTYFITLNPTVASTGTMTINFGATPAAGGTFSSSLDVNYDLRFGSLTGTVVASGAVLLSSSGTAWGHNPAPGDLQIVNVNSILNTTDHSNDFFVPGPLTEKEPGAIHVVTETGGSVPEPTSIVNGSIGLIFAAAFIRRSMRKRAAQNRRLRQ